VAWSEFERAAQLYHKKILSREQDRRVGVVVRVDVCPLLDVAVHRWIGYLATLRSEPEYGYDRDGDCCRLSNQELGSRDEAAKMRTAIERRLVIGSCNVPDLRPRKREYGGRKAVVVCQFECSRIRFLETKRCVSTPNLEMTRQR